MELPIPASSALTQMPVIPLQASPEPGRAGQLRCRASSAAPARPTGPLAGSSWATGRRFVWGCLVVFCLIILPITANPSSSRRMASTTLKSKGGVEVTILKRGAIIQSLKVPGRDGKVADVVLGFDDEEPYKVRAAAALTAGGKADLNESKCPVLVSMQ